MDLDYRLRWKLLVQKGTKDNFEARSSESRNAPINIAMCVCLHVSARLPLDGISVKFYIGDFYENLSRKSRFG
jgi:hypothetical protein